MTAKPDLVTRLRDAAAGNREYIEHEVLLPEAADAIEARDDDLKNAWMQRDALQETIREYQALMQARDAEIELLRADAKAGWKQALDLRAAAERMAKALDAVPSDPRLMWNYDAWKEARASVAAFREMSE